MDIDWKNGCKLEKMDIDWKNTWIHTGEWTQTRKTHGYTPKIGYRVGKPMDTNPKSGYTVGK